ncbi:DUF6090 family protein [Robiginitalea sp. SC105]|uniref:DUF6090 family protein n=1 Tax=Robiginitalea sp. SC105 TaxID=2762332 RepID=UPI00163AD69B|nr:DUF6090 family protein [Robiginitalea sp. SC105]MBC2838547.1 hypothetical protein [Robiginitalea sp. SC105]
MERSAVHKYLLYAAGEVLLVVLGILIALQVNNWNENRREEDRLKTYLLNLQGALLDDIASLDTTISVNKFRLHGIFYLLKHAGLNDSAFTDIRWVANPDENDGIHKIWKGPYPDSLNRRFVIQSFCWLGRGFGGAAFNHSVINELYATGSFSNIPDPELKGKLGDYYRYLGQRLEGYAIEEHEEWANEVTRFLRDEYGIFTLDVSDMEDPILLIRNRKDVERHLRYLAFEVNYHCIWAASARNMAIELVQLIGATEAAPD